MRMIKGFLFVASGFFILITLISLLIPSQVLTTKSATIHAPKEKIATAIKDLEIWKQWHPVFSNEMVNIQISKPSNTIGSYVEWEQSGKKIAWPSRLFLQKVSNFR